MPTQANQRFDIASVIDERLIALNLDVSTKEEMLEALIDRLEQHGRLHDRGAFLADVMWREGEGRTGIGMGVAIPHGKSSGVQRTALAIGTTAHAMNWDSIDGEPVHVVILFAVTRDDSDVVHLKLLQHVAMLLAHESFVERLRRVDTAHQMLELFESSPGDYDD